MRISSREILRQAGGGYTSWGLLSDSSAFEEAERLQKGFDIHSPSFMDSKRENIGVPTARRLFVCTGTAIFLPIG